MDCSPLSDEEASRFRHPYPSEVLEIAQRHGDKVAFGKNGFLTLLLTSGEANRQILVEHSGAFMKGRQETLMAEAIGWGLIVEEGETHRSQQRALTPALRGEILENYLAAIHQTAREFTDQLLDGSAQSLVDWSRSFTQTSAERALFGGRGISPDFRYHRELLVLNEIAMWGVPTADSSLQRVRDFHGAQAFTAEYTRGLVERWSEGGTGTSSLLDVIMRDPESRGPGQQGLHAQVSLFLQASVETTASLVSWVLMALCEHPRYFDRLVQEASSTGRGSLGYRELATLPWHRAVVNEALRLFPPAWMFPRIATESTVIDGVGVERGTEILLSPWVTQRDRRYFDRPEKFYPERWLDPEWSPARGSYLPFGLGSRICIGERYAKLTGTAMLYHLAGSGYRPVLHGESEGSMLASLISAPSPSIGVQLAEVR